MPLNPVIDHWRDRVVWIVGASTGIGRATAEKLHALGAVVVVSARNVNALGGFVGAHPGSHAMPLDVGDRTALAAASRQVQITLRSLLILLDDALLAIWDVL